MTIPRFPLYWPNNVPRTAPHARGRPLFNETTITSAVSSVLQEINRLNGCRWNYEDESVIISSNLRLRKDSLPDGSQSEPKDPAVAIYFTLRFWRTGKWYDRPCVLTCDRWVKVALNIDAIARDIEAQRARQRYGCTSVEQAFAGYVAIPEKCGGAPWWTVLGISSQAPVHEIKDAFRTLAKGAHPDQGGDPNKWQALQDAYNQALAAGGAV